MDQIKKSQELPISNYKVQDLKNGLTGTYLYPKDGRYGTDFYLEVEDVGTVCVYGCRDLRTKMKGVDIGSKILIKYEGLITNNGGYSSHSVYVKWLEMPEKLKFYSKRKGVYHV